MTAYDDQQQKIEELVREARLANLTRGELLKRAGAAGLLLGLPASLLGRAGRAAAANSALPAGTMRVAVAFTAAGTNDPLPGPGPEGDFGTTLSSTSSLSSPRRGSWFHRLPPRRRRTPPRRCGRSSCGPASRSTTAAR